MNIFNIVSCGKIDVRTFSTEGSSNGVCPSDSIREYLRSTLQQEIRIQLQTLTQNRGQDVCIGIIMLSVCKLLCSIIITFLLQMHVPIHVMAPQAGPALYT